MSQHGYFKLINFIWFQSIWVMAILWQNQWLWLLIALLALHLLVVHNKAAEISLWVLGGTLGLALDGTLTYFEFFNFSAPPTILPIPLWLMAIWFAFLGTLRHSLSYLLNKPFLAIALGAIFAPISYIAGMRLGAVEFGHDLVTTALTIGIAWGVLMPILLFINDRANHLCANNALTDQEAA